MTQVKYAIYSALLIASAISLPACVEKKEETNTQRDVVQPVPVPGPEKIVPVPGPEKIVPVPGPEKIVPVPTPAPEEKK